MVLAAATFILFAGSAFAQQSRAYLDPNQAQLEAQGSAAAGASIGAGMAGGGGTSRGYLDPGQAELTAQQVSRMSPAQIQNALTRMPERQAANLLRQLEPNRAAAALTGLSPSRAGQIINNLDNPSALLRSLSPGQVANLVTGMPSAQASRLINRLSSGDLTALMGSVSPASLNRLVGSLTPSSLAGVLQGMSPDRAASILQGLAPNSARDVLRRMGIGNARAIANALPANSPLRNAVSDITGGEDALASVAGSGPGTGGSGLFAGADNTYRDEEIMCDTNKALGSCPKQPMMMKTTERRSLIKDFTPWLFAYLRDPNDREKPYSGEYYRGTPGDASQTFGLVCPKGRKCPASCRAQIKFRSEARTPEEDAKMVRLQLDNCANQYILYSAIYPLQKANSRLLSNEDPNDGNARVGLETSCQPLQTVLDTRNEYFASDYLKAAWVKLMQDPTYRKNPKAPNEPHLPTGVTIENPVPPPSPFPDVRLSMIGGVPYEEINDPTHPFSPRWDYEFNERDHYSPKTQSYSNDPANAVFCAGDKTQNVIKVDILSFREAVLQFDDKINKRINFNKNCKANSGLQKNPCCAPMGLYCKLLPCSVCYGMTAASPVCSTDYVNPNDRKVVRAPLLPVAPALRIFSMVQSLSNLSLSNLNSLTGGVMNVAQARALLSSVSGVLSALPVDLPFAQALPMLNNLASMVENLPANISPDTLLKTIGSQTNLLQQLPGGLNATQLSGLLKGQESSLIALGQNVTGMPIGNALGAIRSGEGLLNAFPVNTPLGNTRELIQLSNMTNQQLADRGLTVGAAQLGIANELRILNSLRPDMTLGDAAAAGIRLTSVDLPPGLSVNHTRNILNSLQEGMKTYDQTASMRSFAGLVTAQNAAILGMPRDIPVGQIGSLLRSNQDLVKGLAGIGENQAINYATRLEGRLIGDASQAINGQIRSLTGLPVNISSSDIRGVLTGQQGLVSMLKDNFSPQMLRGALNGQINQLTGIAGLGQALTTGQINGLLAGQLGALANLPGISSLASVAGSIDGAMGLANSLGSIGQIGSIANAGQLMSQAPKGSLPTIVVAAAIPSIGLDPRRSRCDPAELPTPNKVPMAQLCRELRKPFTPLNKLKMRYHNPEDEENIVLKEGAVEGYTFKEYFGKNMPYPRLWDTGRSIQRTQSDIQDPRDDMGQYTTIVGVGHEGQIGEAPEAGDTRESQAAALRHTDQRCMLGGWGGNVSMGGASITLPDPVASWTEMKLYQTRTLRDTQLSCLGRYEKVFKNGASENLALAALGAAPSVATYTLPVADGSKRYSTLAQRREAGEEIKSTDVVRLMQTNYPLAWRGYMSAIADEHRFPDFGGEADTETGLDNAKQGDIIIMENGPGGTDSKRELPRVALVTDDMSGNNVRILESDNGKWPDVCGTTDTWGEMKKRTIYKPGNLPATAREGLQRLGSPGKCSDPHLGICEADNWDEIKIYRVRENVREGNDGSEMKTPVVPRSTSTPVNRTGT